MTLQRNFEPQILVAPEDNLYLQAVEETPEEIARLMDFVHDPHNYPHLTRFESWPREMNQLDATEYVGIAASNMDLGNTLEYRITQRVDNEHVLLGGVNLYARSANQHGQQSAKMAYFVAHDAQGKGYVSRSARQLLRHASRPDVWDLGRVDLLIDPKNTPSQWVARSLGAMVIASTLGHGQKMQQWTKEWEGVYEA